MGAARLRLGPAREPSALVLRKFANEWLVLCLVAVAVLAFTHPVNSQDRTRLSLTMALVDHGEVAIDRYGASTDVARKDGRLYTDKAPGLSLLAVPAVAVGRLVENVAGRERAPVWESPAKLWLLRSGVVGTFLLLLTWLVGRVAEGVAPGAGAPTAVAAALGTVLGPLSGVLFSHVPAACLGFAAYVLAQGRGGRRGLAAGALAGALVLVEYQAVLVVLPLAVYIAQRQGVRQLTWFVLGGLPFAVTLAVYDAVAFGAPWRLSYQYVYGPFAALQDQGLFGLGRPRMDSLLETLVGERGLLLFSPVLLAAAAGLVLLLRGRYRADAVLCTSVTLLFLTLSAGYYLPYGGFSPGPRFVTPALPFLLVGLPAALCRWPRTVLALLAVSVVLMTANTLTWPGFAPSEPFAPRLPDTLLSRLGAPRSAGAAVAVLAALSALGVAFVRAGRLSSGGGPSAPTPP